MAEIDGEWFRRKLIGRQTSQRQLAKFLGVDPSAISLLFDGKRKMQFNEAEQIASFLGEPLHSVLRAAGLPLQDRHCPIIGWLDENGQLETTNLGSIEVPTVLPKGTVAARIRAKRGAWAVFNDAVIFFKI